MATIKDVARLAEVSPTTVSIVINGKAGERKIPEETCRRIERAMNDLRYRPNISARRLRSHESNKPTIAFFWPMDYLINIMSIIVNGLLRRLNDLDFDCEFIVQTYENGHIEKIIDRLIRNEYHAAIIGCATQHDIDYVDSMKIGVPIIFLNRVSKKYPYVAVDIKKMVGTAARLFAEKGHRQVGVLTSAQSYYASDRRVRYFLEACRERGISVKEEHIIKTENSIKGGCAGMERYLALLKRPGALFCNSDIIALGAVSCCNRLHVGIPEDIGIIAVGLMDPQFAEFAVPSLTAVSMPTGEITSHMIDLIVAALQKKSALDAHDFLEPHLFIRESFRP